MTVEGGSTPMIEEVLDVCDSYNLSRMESYMVAGRQGPTARRNSTGLVRGGRRSKVEHHSIFSRFHLVVSKEDVVQDNSHFAYFSIEGVLSYVGFCDDFGPMSLGTIFQFCGIVDHQLKENPDRPIAMVTSAESTSLTNAVFLIGSYMIMKLGMAPADVEACFEALEEEIISYRDVSPGKQNFELFVRDCWGGLWRAKSLGWVSFSSNGFDPEEYEHYDDPLNADLHEVLPGKFVAMRGPKDLPGGSFWKDSFAKPGEFSHRDFSPQHYIDILAQFNVKSVVRLNSSEYDKSGFENAGIAVADLFFEDCTDPPAEIVGKFMMLAEGISGAIAVHCKAGLGRTGTLIALYMMKHHGFSAREAMGWLRIVRPGSVIGTQQQFLCSKEALMRRAADKFRREGPKRAIAAGAGPRAVRRFISDVHSYVDVRLQAFHAAAPATALPPAQPSRRPGRPSASGSLIRPGDKVASQPAPPPAHEVLAAHVAAASDRRNGVRALGAPLPPLACRH